jgi:hypothetical protein
MSDVKNTLAQRGNRYGGIEENAELTQHMMDSIIEYQHKLSPVHKECLHMIFHKISRMVVGDPNYADNAHDIAGYAKLLEDYINEHEND